VTIHFVVLDESPSVAQLEMARGLVREYAALPHTVGRWSPASADIAALPAPFVHLRGVFVIAMNEARLCAAGGAIAWRWTGDRVTPSNGITRTHG
jgi:hypothetical protein